MNAVIGKTAQTAVYGGFAGMITSPRMGHTTNGSLVQTGGMMLTGAAATLAASRFDTEVGRGIAGITTGALGGAATYLGAALVTNGNIAHSRTALILTGVVGALMGTMVGVMGTVQADLIAKQS